MKFYLRGQGTAPHERQRLSIGRREDETSRMFAMASAVVTDVGGPLSHSSIVAREYGIPAVLGTGVATQRLRSGRQIPVDGDAGTFTIEHPAPA